MLSKKEIFVQVFMISVLFLGFLIFVFLGVFDFVFFFGFSDFMDSILTSGPTTTYLSTNRRESDTYPPAETR